MVLFRDLGDLALRGALTYGRSVGDTITCEGPHLFVLLWRPGIVLWGIERRQARSLCLTRRSCRAPEGTEACGLPKNLLCVTHCGGTQQFSQGLHTRFRHIQGANAATISAKHDLDRVLGGGRV